MNEVGADVGKRSCLEVVLGDEAINKAVTIVVVVVVEEKWSKSHNDSAIFGLGRATPRVLETNAKIAETPILIFLRLLSVRIPPA